MRVKQTQKDLFVCSCHSTEHQMVVMYSEDEIDGMAWKSVKLVDVNSNEVYSYHADNITGIFAFCTSYCIKESSKNMYGSYSLI